MYNELTEVDIRKMQEEIDYRMRVVRPKCVEDVATAASSPFKSPSATPARFFPIATASRLFFHSMRDSAPVRHGGTGMAREWHGCDAPSILRKAVIHTKITYGLPKSKTTAFAFPGAKC